MEDKPNSENVDEESSQRKESETNDVSNPSRVVDSRINSLNDSDPSTSLPGSVESPKVIKPGLSKSEHNIRHIITRNDVAAALKMSSVNFIPNNLNKNMNFKDIIIPGVHKGSNNKYEMDFLKKNLMKSCLAKDGCNIRDMANISEVHTVLSNANTNIRSEVANSSCITTANVAKVTNVKTVINDLLPTNKVPEVKVNKVPNGSNNSVAKKKASGNLSERSDFGITQRDSMSSIGSNVCRICMTRGRERLISPCNCKGSLANVHLTCLERWLNQVGRNHCELCGFSYPAIRTPRYTVLQALRLWFGNPRNRSHLQSDCLIFWLLSTVTAGLLAVCIVGTQYFVLEGSKFGKPDAPRKEGGLSHRITETAMDFFMAIVLCGYSVTVYLLWKDHYVMWNRWRRANVNVRLLLTPDSNPVPFVPRSRYNIV